MENLIRAPTARGPGKSAHQGIEQARKRCWQHDWVVDLDIKSFFDTIDHELLMRAVYRHTKGDWIRLYIERWLKAPVEMPDGSVQAGTTGTPQGVWSVQSWQTCSCTTSSTFG